MGLNNPVASRGSQVSLVEGFVDWNAARSLATQQWTTAYHVGSLARKRMLSFHEEDRK